MAAKRKTSAQREITRQQRRDERTSADVVPDTLGLAQALIGPHQQMLRFASLTTEALRRQMQTQADYVVALFQCRDLVALSHANAEYARRVAENVTTGWQDITGATERPTP